MKHFFCLESAWSSSSNLMSKILLFILKGAGVLLEAKARNVLMSTVIYFEK